MSRSGRERRRRLRRRHVNRFAAVTDAAAKQKGPSLIHVIKYDHENLVETQIENREDLATYRDESGVVWIDVVGVEDESLIEQIGAMFDIHHLILDDIVNTGQRAKLEQSDGKTFLFMHEAGAPPDFNHHQIAIAFGDSWVITFRESHSDCFDQVVERLRNKVGSIRAHGADHLVYAILDAIIDTYFPALEHCGEQLEMLEDEIIDKPSRNQARSSRVAPADVADS
jgi:magnesium transporter